MTEAETVPVAERLFTWPSDEPQLIASRHPRTGDLSFPAAHPAAGEEELLLSRVGTLFTWTTQQFVPPSPPYVGDTDPASFEPYAVGYVELPEGLLVEGRLTESNPDRLRIGQPMELVVVPFLVRGTGGQPDREVVTFAFAPVAEVTSSTAGETAR
jgi:uncharacterized OB-fold protein